MRPLKNSFAILILMAAHALGQLPPGGLGDPAAWVGPEQGLRLRIAQLAEEATDAKRQRVLGELAELASEAQNDQNHEAMAEANYWILRLTLEEDSVARVGVDFGELIAHCQKHALFHALVETLQLRARWHENLEDEMSAARDCDTASQFAFAAGAPNAGISCLLDLVRVFRQIDHPWRARQAWTRLEIALSENQAQLTEPTKTAVEAARAANVEILSRTKTPLFADPIVDLQPAASSIRVSSQARDGEPEKARARFCLSNPSSLPADGELVLAISSGTVTETSDLGEDVLLTISPAAEASLHTAKLTLRPGQQMFVYLEHLPGTGADAVSLTWSDHDSVQKVDARFVFEPDGRQSCVVNASKNRPQAAFPTAFYHEVYYRGGEPHIENVHVYAPGKQARLEIFDQDSGQLLGIDAEGDGAYDGPNDWLAQDQDGNGHLDIVLGPRRPVGSLEIYAFPLQGDDGPVNIALSLIEEGQSGPTWRTDAEDKLEPSR